MPKGRRKRAEPKSQQLLLNLLREAWVNDWVESGGRWSAMNIDTAGVQGIGLVLGSVFVCVRCEEWKLRAEHGSNLCNECKAKLPEPTASIAQPPETRQPIKPEENQGTSHGTE